MKKSKILAGLGLATLTLSLASCSWQDVKDFFNGEPTTPPVVETTEVPEPTTPPVVETTEVPEPTTPPVVETTKVPEPTTPPVVETTEVPEPTTPPVVETTEVPEPTTPPVTEEQPAVKAKFTHSFTESGLDSDFFDISGNLKTNQPSVTYNDVTYTTCLNMESSTSITFETEYQVEVTLVMTSSKEIKVDNVTYTCENDTNEVVVTLAAGSHSITKGTSSTYLYYIEINEI